MTSPGRIVDAHVHLWDPARTDWYPYLGGRRDLGMGDVTGMARRFDADTYRQEAAAWPVDKLVNVAAATGRHCVEETLELDRRAATDDPLAAIVGGLPGTDTVAEAVELIDQQLGASRLRGVRPMAPNGPAVPTDEVLVALVERELVLEVMAHPDQLVDVAHRLEAHPDLTVVVEHTGWPCSADSDERRRWLAGIAALAAAGAKVHCKLSGLAMPLAAVDAASFRPWLEPAIATFGTRRCLFASNFPVDGLHGTLDQLWTAYTEVTAGLGAADLDLLYAANAERIYRC